MRQGSACHALRVFGLSARAAISEVAFFPQSGGHQPGRGKAFRRNSARVGVVGVHPDERGILGQLTVAHGFASQPLEEVSRIA